MAARQYWEIIFQSQSCLSNVWKLRTTMFHMIWHCNKLLATKAEHCSTQIYREYLCTTHTFTSHKVAHSHFITGNIETLHWRTELPAEVIAFLWCTLSKHTICFHNIPGRSAASAWAREVYSDFWGGKKRHTGICEQQVSLLWPP